MPGPTAGELLLLDRIGELSTPSLPVTSFGMDISQFIERWSASGGSERANYQLFLSELCDVLEVPRPDPASDNTRTNDYVFERRVQYAHDASRSHGFIDLYKRGCFVCEAKQGSDAPTPTEAEQLGVREPIRKLGTARRGTRHWEQAMKRAKNQASRYAKGLPDRDGWPPFLLAVDVGHCIDVYSDFARQGKNYVPFPDQQRYRIHLQDLADPDIQERLRRIFTEPLTLDPTRRATEVTVNLAQNLAQVAASLEADGYAADRVSGFLMRCLFTMFAEDVGLFMVHDKS